MLPAVIPQTIPLLASSTNDNKRARLRCVDVSISRISSSFSIIARITLECALEFEPLYLDVVSDSVGHTAYRVNSFHLLRPIENRMSLSIYTGGHTCSASHGPTRQIIMRVQEELFSAPVSIATTAVNDSPSLVIQRVKSVLSPSIGI